MTYFIHDRESDAAPIVTQDLSRYDLAILIRLRVGATIDITHPGLQPWNSKVWKRYAYHAGDEEPK